MAAKTKASPKTKITVGDVNKNKWTRFKAKCKKANMSASERIRQLIDADIKV